MIQTTGLRQVSVDHIKIYDQLGKDLIENAMYAEAVRRNLEWLLGQHNTIVGESE